VIWCFVLFFIPAFIFRKLFDSERLQLWELDVQFQRQLRNTFKQLKIRPRENNKRFLYLKMALAAIRYPFAVLLVYLFVSLLTWIYTDYGYTQPQVGQWIQMQPFPQTSKVPKYHWQPRESATWSTKLQAWVVQWPNRESEFVMYSTTGGELFRIRAEYPGHELLSHHWIHYFWPNQAGYLSNNSQVERIVFHLKPRRYLPWGPAWVRSWWFILLSVALLYTIFILLKTWYRTDSGSTVKVLQRRH